VSTPGTRLLEVEHISKRYAGAGGVITAVDDISFGVDPGEFVSIIGPSGCGKSTLFNIIGGLIGDYDGRVAVAGATISGTHPAIGMVFQEESTFPWRTVADNVAFPLELAGTGRPARIRSSLSCRAVRRHAATRCHRAYAGVRTAHPADG
jgi:NitT/TauT family transport system ATP-binding protein